MSSELSVSSLARTIDHSFLRADATEEQLARVCAEAIEWGFATVAINSSPVAFCAERLAGTPVGIPPSI